MRLLLTGGAVFDGEQTPLPGHAVLTDGEEIVALGPADAFDGCDAERVDTTGMTVLPGLIDCHVHLCFGAEADPIPLLGQLSAHDFALRALEHAQRALHGGVTTVRDLGGVNYAEIAVRNRIARGHSTGPTILCAGKMICITGGHGWFIGIEADGVDAVVKAVRTNLKAGADWIKFMATGGVMTPGIDPLLAHFTAGEVGALVAEANRLSRRTACHATGAAGIALAVRAGVDSVEHGFELTDDIVREMIERGTVLVPTLSAMAAAQRHGAAALPGYVTDRIGRLHELHHDSVRRFYRAGGRLAMGTDAGTPFNRHGENAQELAHLARLGVSAHDALRAATAAAADLLGLPDRGRVRARAKADLLVVAGAPLEDIRAVSDPGRHVLVIKNGKPLRRAPRERHPTLALPAAAFNDPQF